MYNFYLKGLFHSSWVGAEVENVCVYVACMWRGWGGGNGKKNMEAIHCNYHKQICALFLSKFIMNLLGKVETLIRLLHSDQNLYHLPFCCQLKNVSSDWLRFPLDRLST